MVEVDLRDARTELYMKALGTQHGPSPLDALQITLMLDVPRRERDALEFRYGTMDGYVHTWADIGARLGVSSVRARQLANKALRIVGRKLKERLS